MPHIAAIQRDISKEIPILTIWKKIFISYPTKFFIDKYDDQFDIFEKISNNFQIPITSIQVTGSAKTGCSLFKGTDFIIKESDLDISIISSDLYCKYLQLSLEKSNSYADLTKFSRNINGQSEDKQFRSTLAKGLLRPDLMPNCKEKEDWLDFFNDLSQSYKSYFDTISAGIYLSELTFQLKQVAALEHHINRGHK